MSESSGPTPRGQRGGGRHPVDSKTRALVRKLARGGMSRNAIARQTKISTASVSKICAEARPPILFDRAATAAATEAKVIDAKALRVEMSQLVMTEAKRIVDKFSAAHVLTHFDKEGIMHRGSIDGPQSGDVKNYAIALGILIDKHLTLVKADGDGQNLADVDAWLESRMAG